LKTRADAGTLAAMVRSAAARIALFAGLLAVAAPLTGCGPRWAIIRQASPDPLVGARSFYCEPIHYDPPSVGDKTEAQYLADKTTDQRDAWLTDKSDTSNRFVASLSGAIPEAGWVVQPAPGTFIIRPIVSFIEPGFYAGIVQSPTQLRMRVQILSSEGLVIDDIAIPSAIPGSMIYPASGQRMRLAGEDLGRVTAAYLRKRIVPGS
jgi:hypothetical protein